MIRRRDPVAMAFAGFSAVYSTLCAAATWSAPFAFVGVPAPVVFMAFAGAATGLIVQPPAMSRVAMLLTTLAFTFFAASAAVLVGAVPGFRWVQDAAPAAAGVVAFFSQALVPAVRDRLKREVKDRGAPENTGGAQ